MIVDTSALLAIARNEPERDSFALRLAEKPSPAMTSVTWMESQMVMLGRMREAGLLALRGLVASSRIRVVPVSVELADAAFEAFRLYGKGQHAAGLNFGDCFAYALAKTMNVPLLFKGNDFSRTDIVPAVRIA
jgi:ribonuclease VapC